MNFRDNNNHRIVIGDCPNFHVMKMGLSPSAFKWLVLLLLCYVVQENNISAQTPLERLEQQIRQRVSPSQEGTAPYRQPATSPSPAVPQPRGAVSPDKAQYTTGQSEGVYLGVTADDRKDRGRGVRITDLRPGSPAEKAGFRKQDLVTAFMGVRVRQLSDMTEMLRLYQPEDLVEFDILRDGQPEKLKVTLGRRPGASAPANRTAEVIPLPPGELILPEPSPAKITSTPAQTNSPGDREKIERMQKRIVELERQVADLERALAEAEKNNK